MSATYYLVLVILDIVTTIVVIPEFIIRRIILLVIHIFRRAGAVGASDAKAISELGITARLARRIMQRFNYRPHALNLLISANIIKKTEDERLYLSEEDLSRSPWKGQQNNIRSME